MVPRERGRVGQAIRAAGHRGALQLRVWAHRDQQYAIAGFPVTLPPGHRLPWYQDIHPTYDRYAAEVLREVCAESSRPLLVDVGANVGDTALLALRAVPPIHVLAVEGDPYFLGYLRRNTAQVVGRVTVIPAFVQAGDRDRLEYRTDGSTGGFVRSASGVATPGISAAELLQQTDGHDLVIWKSDTDGLDVTLLIENWDSITDRCSVLWFELHPGLDVDRGRRVPDLVDLLRGIEGTLTIFDNLGQRMLSGPASCVAPQLTELDAWLRGTAGRGAPPYVDVWVVGPASDGTAGGGLR